MDNETPWGVKIYKLMEKSCVSFYDGIKYRRNDNIFENFLKNNRYFKYPIISKLGYDFGIDYNNSNAFACSMWDWKNQHIYRWRKRYHRV